MSCLPFMETNLSAILAKPAIYNQMAIGRIAGTVILYNSDWSVINNIETYINQIEKLYVIDNSDQPDTELVQQFDRLTTIQYISNNGNRGIAYALNRAADLALQDGFQFLLTMDDDTNLPSDAVDIMRRFLDNSTDYIGMISGVHSANLVTNKPWRAVLYTMTSGNLLNLQAYQQVGPFRNDLFIDHVDHEYGLRLNAAGFKVIELPALRINHQLGRSVPIGLWAKTFISHTPVRAYYMVRNGWVVAAAYRKQFPAFKWQAMVWIAKEWLKTILFEDQKIRRLGLLWRGTVDALRGQLGKLDEQP